MPQHGPVSLLDHVQLPKHREGLASGKALQTHLSAAACRAWSAAVVQPRVEPPILRGTGSIAITTLAVQICTFCASALFLYLKERATRASRRLVCQAYLSLLRLGRSVLAGKVCSFIRD